MAVLDSKGGNQGGDKDKALTMDLVLGEVGKLIDAKVGAKFDDFKKTGLGEAIKAQVDPINASLGTINEALGKLVAGNGGGDNRGGGDNKGQIPPEINQQMRQLNETVKNQGSTISALQKAKEDAEKKAEETDRHSQIRTAISNLPFVNDQAARTAFSIVVPHVRRLDDGGLVAGVNGDNFPVDAFSKDYLEKEHSYLFRSSGVTGSGAPNGGSGGQQRYGEKTDIGTIKVGMKAEDRAAAVAAISSVLAAQ